MQRAALCLALGAMILIGATGCRVLPDVDWAEDQCQIDSNSLASASGTTPGWQTCLATFASQGFFDKFELNLTSSGMGGDEELTLYLTGDGGTIGPGRYEVEGTVDEYEWDTALPRQLYANFGGAVTVEEFSFKTVGGGPLGLGILDLGTTTGTFSVRLTFEPGSSDRGFSGALEASGENLPEPFDPFGGSGGPERDPCLIGAWDSPPGCLNESNTLHFNADGSGKGEFVDCWGQCTKDQNYFEYTWEANPERTQLTKTYGAGLTCGTPNNSAAGTSDSESYTCSGSSLTYDGVTWTKK